MSTSNGDSIDKGLQKLKITTAAIKTPTSTPPRSSRSRSLKAEDQAPKVQAKASTDVVADSWEDDAGGSPSDDEQARWRGSEVSSPQRQQGARAPPPTPATASPGLAATDWSQSAARFNSIGSTFASGAPQEADESDEEHSATRAYRREMERGGSLASKNGMASEKRPEKSTAVASRLIAAGLGVKAPRRTEEQREYDKAIRAQERRRKEQEAEEERRKKEESERAKKAIWDD